MPRRWFACMVSTSSDLFRAESRRRVAPRAHRRLTMPELLLGVHAGGQGDHRPPMTIKPIRRAGRRAPWAGRHQRGRPGTCRADPLRGSARPRPGRGYRRRVTRVGEPGAVTARTTRPSIPVKSSGFAVYSGKPVASAVAAIMASNERAAGFRPDRRNEAATRPKARAAAASNGSGSKSASACWTVARRRARSASSVATSGPTESSARVTAEIRAMSGRAEASAKACSASTTLVSSRPCGSLTAIGR